MRQGLEGGDCHVGGQQHEDNKQATLRGKITRRCYCDVKETSESNKEVNAVLVNRSHRKKSNAMAYILATYLSGAFILNFYSIQCCFLQVWTVVTGSRECDLEQETESSVATHLRS